MLVVVFVCLNFQRFHHQKETISKDLISTLNCDKELPNVAHWWTSDKLQPAWPALRQLSSSLFFFSFNVPDDVLI
jgi:hypothetical protein